MFTKLTLKGFFGKSDTIKYCFSNLWTFNEEVSTDFNLYEPAFLWVGKKYSPKSEVIKNKNSPLVTNWQNCVIAVSIQRVAKRQQLLLDRAPCACPAQLEAAQAWHNPVTLATKRANWHWSTTKLAECEEAHSTHYLSCLP